jgi:predicted Zn-dependent protease
MERRIFSKESTVSRNSVMERLGKATQDAKDGNLDEAVTTLKQILCDEPRHEIALGMLAATYLQIGMHEAAIERFQALLEAHPKNPLARFQLGMALLGLERPQEALNAWRPLLDGESDFMGHFHSALALIQLGRRAEAMPLLECAAQRMPASHPLYGKALELLSDRRLRVAQ